MCPRNDDFKNMTEQLQNRLQYLATKYETANFLASDPSQFLRYYKNPQDAEVASFVAALLSFGNRKLFIPKIREIFVLADLAKQADFAILCAGKQSDETIFCEWIKSGRYKKDFCSPNNNDETKFYRFYSYNDIKDLFATFQTILQSGETFGNFIRKKYEAAKTTENCKVSQIDSFFANFCISKVISETFKNCKIVPKGKNSANKRVNMYLRWLVRQNSPVDLGLWTWFSPADLIIPLDTHVVQEAEKLGLIPNKSSASLKTAKQLTSELKKVWQTDPTKGDFALFGLGVDSEKEK